MTRQMPAGAQVAFAKDWFERQGIPAETIDVAAYIDRSLSYEENIKNLRRQFGAGKRGMDAPKVARGMTAAECDVAIGNFDAGYNHQVTKDACACGHPDACEKLEQRRAAKPKKTAAKPQPPTMEPTATEVAWQAARLHEREAAASKTVATAKPEVRLFPPPDPKKKDYKPAKTWEAFVRLNEPQITRHTAGIKEWASDIKDRKKGEKLFQREVREYRIAITDIWSETKLKTEPTPPQTPAAALASKPIKAAKPKRAECVYRVDEFKQIAFTWYASSWIPLQNSLDAAKKLVAKATKKRQRQIDKANRDWRPNAWGADPEHGPRRIVKICNGKEVEYYPATKADEARYPENKAMFHKVGAGAHKTAAKKPAAAPQARKPAPTPSVPPILTAPPELAVDVLGGGMGLTPTPAAKPKRKSAAKPKKQPKKTAAAKTRKTAKKTAKPKAKKTAATPKLTPSQREYLAIQGFVMVKRGGKYVRITG